MRLVVPLPQAPALTKKPIARLTPSFDIDGERYLLMTPQLAGIARSELGAAVGNIVDQRSTIISALDLLIAGV
jgi:toxin CcdB